MSLKTMTSREILLKILLPVLCVFAVGGATLGAFFGTGVIWNKKQNLQPPKPNFPVEVPDVPEEPPLEADTSIYDLTYMDSMGGYQITGVKVQTLDADLKLPDVCGGVPIVDIGAWCFGHHVEIESVKIPNGVTTIGDFAFVGCTSIESVTIGNSVTSIGSDAFGGCESLTEVVIPNSVVYIGHEAFVECYSLASVTIGNSVIKIEGAAFGKCYRLVEIWNLSSLEIEAGSLDHGYVAYYAIEVYTDASVPSKVSKDANGFLTYADAEKGLYVLVGYEGTETNITLPDNIAGNNYEIGGYAFSLNSKIISVVIPNSVTSIGQSAFLACTGLTEITIPNSVTSVGNLAFSECTSLGLVTIGAGVTSIGSWVFNSCICLEEIVFDDGINWANLVLDSYSMPSQTTTLVVEGTNQATIETALTKLSASNWKSKYTIQIDASLVGVISNTYGFAAIEPIQ